MNRRAKLTAAALLAAGVVTLWGAWLDGKSNLNSTKASIWAALFDWVGLPATRIIFGSGAMEAGPTTIVQSPRPTWDHWSSLGQAIAPSPDGWAANRSSLDSTEEYLLLKDHYRWLNREILRTVRLEAQANQIPALLVLAVIDAESTGRVRARGPAVRVRLASGQKVWTRALGLMQLIPEFHAMVEKKSGRLIWRWNLYHAPTNIRLGTAYLAQCLQWAGGQWAKGLKNYNSGPRSNYFNWPYIKKILANYERTRQRLKSRAPANAPNRQLAAVSSRIMGR